MHGSLLNRLLTTYRGVGERYSMNVRQGLLPQMRYIHNVRGPVPRALTQEWKLVAQLSKYLTLLASSNVPSGIQG